MKTMNITEYLDLIEKHRNLTSHGFGIEVDPDLGLTHEQTFDMAREELKRSYDTFRKVCDWMKAQGELKPGRAACFWKVDIENALGDHVYQGIVILAGIALGYKVHRIRGSLGARFGKWVGVSQDVRIPKGPGKLTVIREAGWHCPMLVTMK